MAAVKGYPPTAIRGPLSSPDQCTRVLLALIDMTSAGPWPPTLRELSARCGYSLSAVAQAIRVLDAHGLVTHVRMQPRTLVPTVRKVA